MKKGFKIKAESKALSALRFLVLFVLILELGFSGIALFGYSKDSLHVKGFIKDDSTLKLYNFDDTKEKSLSVSAFSVSTYELEELNFGLVNTGPVSNYVFKRLHSRSPPIQLSA